MITSPIIEWSRDHMSGLLTTSMLINVSSLLVSKSHRKARWKHSSTANQQQARVNFIPWCHLLLFGHWSRQHHVKLIYFNLQASVRSPKGSSHESFFTRFDSPLQIDSYSTMSSTLLEEEYPLTVGFVGPPEMFTSYLKRRQIFFTVREVLGGARHKGSS